MSHTMMAAGCLLQGMLPYNKDFWDDDQPRVNINHGLYENRSFRWQVVRDTFNAAGAPVGDLVTDTLEVPLPPTLRRSVRHNYRLLKNLQHTHRQPGTPRILVMDAPVTQNGVLLALLLALVHVHSDCLTGSEPADVPAVRLRHSPSSLAHLTVLCRGLDLDNRCPVTVTMVQLLGVAAFIHGQQCGMTDAQAQWVGHMMGPAGGGGGGGGGRLPPVSGTYFVRQGGKDVILFKGNVIGERGSDDFRRWLADRDKTEELTELIDGMRDYLRIVRPPPPQQAKRGAWKRMWDSLSNGQNTGVVTYDGRGTFMLGGKEKLPITVKDGPPRFVGEEVLANEEFGPDLKEYVKHNLEKFNEMLSLMPDDDEHRKDFIGLLNAAGSELAEEMTDDEIKDWLLGIRDMKVLSVQDKEDIPKRPAPRRNNREAGQRRMEYERQFGELNDDESVTPALNILPSRRKDVEPSAPPMPPGLLPAFNRREKED